MISKTNSQILYLLFLTVCSPIRSALFLSYRSIFLWAYRCSTQNSHIHSLSLSLSREGVNYIVDATIPSIYQLYRLNRAGKSISKQFSGKITPLRTTVHRGKLLVSDWSYDDVSCVCFVCSIFMYYYTVLRSALKILFRIYESCVLHVPICLYSSICRILKSCCYLVCAFIWNR